MAAEQRTVLFAGRVQGVGFRFTACRLAGRYDVTGTVRNLPDGRVECVIEGEAAEIDAFLAALRERMSGYIRDETSRTAAPTGRYAGFDVAF
jgi:acylphosphatase